MVAVRLRTPLRKMSTPDRSGIPRRRRGYKRRAGYAKTIGVTQDYVQNALIILDILVLIDTSIKQPTKKQIMSPLIALGAGLFGQAVNAFSTSNTNKQQIQFQKEMYQTQRQDSLADWNMNNAYNHPTQQMMRLKEAGLNPHLVYGNGATTTAQQASPSSTPFASLKAPQVDIGSAIASYQQVEMQKQSIDNLQKQGMLLDAEKEAKAAQIIETHERARNINVDTLRKEFDYGVESELRPISLASREAALNKLYADTSGVINDTQVKTALANNTLAQGVEDILTKQQNRTKTAAEINNIRETLQSIKKDNQIKDFEIQLNQRGLTKSDDAYYRIGSTLVNSLLGGKTITQAIGDAKQYVDKSVEQTKATKGLNLGVPTLNPFLPWNWKK